MIQIFPPGSIPREALGFYGRKFYQILGTIRALLTPNVTKLTQNDTPRHMSQLHP